MTGSNRNNDHNSTRGEPSDRFFRALEDCSPSGVMVTDRDGLIRYMNPSVLKMLGYRTDDLLGRGVVNIIHPDSRGAFVDFIGSDALKTGNQARFRTVFLHRDGFSRQMDMAAVNAIDHPDIQGIVLHFHQPVPDGDPCGDLADSEKKYRLLCENTREIILLIQDGVIRFANSRAETMTGFSLEELVGRGMLEFFLPESVDLALERHAQAMAGKVMDEPAVYRVQNRWGDKRWLSAIGIPISWEGSISVLFFGEDITDRVEAENALRESEEAYRTIFDFVGDSVVVIQDNRFVFANPKTVELFGYDLETLAKSNTLDLVHPDQREMVNNQYQQRLDSTVKQDQYEFSVRNSSGEWREVEAKTVSFTWKGAPASLGILRDITERRQRMDEALHKEKLRGAIETAGAVCHELNQPLQSIMGQIQLLLADLADDNENRKYLEVIIDQSREMAEITKKLQGITQYATTKYVKGKKILDLEKASERDWPRN